MLEFKISKNVTNILKRKQKYTCSSNKQNIVIFKTRLFTIIKKGVLDK